MTDVRLVCQKCLRERASTKNRTLYAAEYRGPCGDSFCYASCDSPACRAIDVKVCDECEPKVGRKPR